MARKATVTENMLLENAFTLLREEGFEQVTARRLAARTGCSTQPIFRLYENMDELIQEVYEKAVIYFEEYYGKYPDRSRVPFVNLAMAYIQFALEEKNTFRLLFLSERRKKKSMYELLNGSKGTLGKEIGRAKELGVRNPGELFMKMWIFIHGAACMSLTGDYDLTRGETIVLLEEVFYEYSGETK